MIYLFWITTYHHILSSWFPTDQSIVTQLIDSPFIDPYYLSPNQLTHREHPDILFWKNNRFYVFLILHHFQTDFHTNYTWKAWDEHFWCVFSDLRGWQTLCHNSYIWNSKISAYLLIPGKLKKHQNIVYFCCSVILGPHYLLLWW